MFQVLSDVIYPCLRSHKINTHISPSLSKCFLCSLFINALIVFQFIGIKIEFYGFYISWGKCCLLVRQNSAPFPVDILNVSVPGLPAKKQSWRGNCTWRMKSPDKFPQKFCIGEVLAFSLFCLERLFFLSTVRLSVKNNTYATLHSDFQRHFFLNCSDYQIIVILFQDIPMCFNSEKSS